jgi:hypothetical protein
MACLSEHVLGLNSCRWFSRWWLRFDVIEDLLDYVWVSDPKAAPSDDACGSTTQWAQANINTKDSFERFAIATLRPS